MVCQTLDHRRVSPRAQKRLPSRSTATDHPRTLATSPGHRHGGGLAHYGPEQSGPSPTRRARRPVVVHGRMAGALLLRASDPGSAGETSDDRTSRAVDRAIGGPPGTQERRPSGSHDVVAWAAAPQRYCRVVASLRPNPSRPSTRQTASLKKFKKMWVMHRSWSAVT